MIGPRAEGEEPPPEGAGGGPVRRARIWAALTVAGVVVALVAVVAGGFRTRPDDPRVVASPPSEVPSSSSAAPSAASDAPLIAFIDDNGALGTMDEHGGSVVSYAVPGVVFGFPAWSPDGLHIAAVGYRADDTSIYVFARRRPGLGTAEPVVIYRSTDRPPFYLYWTPGGGTIAFLATEPDGLSLRVAPADGSAPLDGSGPDSIIRRGAPLYFDWESSDRVLLHVGNGPGGFVGEVGLDGAGVGPALPGTGDFRSASASPDGRYLAYARSATDSPGEIVVASRDGPGQHELPVFGPAAFVFEPMGDTLASIAADNVDAASPTIPLGPLRLIDARSGAVRTLLDGSVVAFFWAPDGRTIAALRLAVPGDQTADTGAILAAAALGHSAAAATPPPGAEVRIAFVDVSTGVVRFERSVRLAIHFVDRLLPYFDQYALSHRLWAPDSSSILLPLVDASGRQRLVIVPADGTASRPLADSASGFWSP